MVVRQGDVCWAELQERSGSAPAFRRPVVVVQGDAFNRSRIMTVICVALTSNLRLADMPGNILLPSRSTGLEKDSVANVSQIVTLDRGDLSPALGRVSRRQIETVLAGIDLVLGRERSHRGRA